jgi:YD repeat-containing protein
MQISVLGPLRVTVAGREVRLPAKQQTLLAILALQPGRVVSTDRLIEALWGDEASPSYAKTLQSHVFQLRKLLAPGPGEPVGESMIVTEGRGYRLAVGPDMVDAQAFERLFDEGRAGSTSDPRHARDVLRAALALWRGPSLPDVGDEPVAAAECERLTELRAAAFDQLVRIRFGLGEYAEAIPELRREVRESPFREQLWASLMVALVRDGRKAEALLAYRDAEAALREELDVEPSQELQSLAARIRDGDPILARADGQPVGADRRLAPSDADSAPKPLEAASPRSAASPPPVASVSSRPSARLMVVAGTLVVVSIAVVTILLAWNMVTRVPGTAEASPSGTPAAAEFPDPGERDLIARLPAILDAQETCSRTPVSERILGAVSSVRCDLPPGSGADTVWYDVLSPPGAVHQRYQDPIQAHSISEGDCRVAPKAWQPWQVSGFFSGHLVCYPDVDGARLLWTYDAQGLVGRARRPDGDPAPLDRWFWQVAPFLRY